ncbi:NXPE family member 3-like [Megalops cyprinoides]|uniref:NXPE family member 3-like n=1 Tax=Megalops cyprinoides TaxID=118141 RepID=UPI0018645161|nr:NXPE family member 3-like [Megalops cyprinoides]
MKKALLLFSGFLALALYVSYCVVHILQTNSTSPKMDLPIPTNRHVALDSTNAVAHQRAPSNDALIGPEKWAFLLKVLHWPSPSKAPSSLIEATDPTKCSYQVIDLQEHYTIGGTVHVRVVTRDGMGRPKTYGGDFFQAKLHNPELKASTFGSVTDHLNGTYTVRFALLWPGPAHVSVRLVHSSEAVWVLGKKREEDPDKVFFHGYFVNGSRTETMVCNAQRSPRLVGGGESCCCEFRDPVTGEAWFCRRPPSLPCHTLTHHSMGGYQAKLSTLETALLHKSRTDIIVPGSDPVIDVLPKGTAKREVRECEPGLDTPVPAGFYFQDQWTSLLCRSQAFPTGDLLASCLRDKQVLMMGDSTLRQWFSYLTSTVPTLKSLNLHTSAKSGPLQAVDPENNIVLVWRAHGLPLRTDLTPLSDLHYIGRELDGLAGGPHTVVVFNIWAHFTTYPLAVYAHRLATIRRAVQDLLRRAPRTLVVIKSANTGYKDVYGSDWLSWQLDLMLRAMFRGLPVVLIDAWQMTSCHYSPDNIHPPQVVIKNEVDLFLSFVCPR